MNKKVWLFLSAITLATGVLAVACGDDDNAGGGTTTPDAGKNDGSTLPGTDAGDGGNTTDGGCTFAGYVTGLISNSTTAQAQPDTTLGQSCTPSTSQDDFKSLFP